MAGGTYGYSFTGTRPNPSPWPASGTWKFGSNVSTQMVRLDDDPDLGMNYVLTDTQKITRPGMLDCPLLGGA